MPLITSLSLALLVATVSPAQDSASVAAARICELAVESAAPIGRPELAAALRQAEASGQTARAAFFRGCQQFAGKRYGKATGEFERAVKLEDSNPLYHYWLARVVGEEASGGANPLRLPGLARRAKAELERAVALAPGFLDAREGLVEYYLAAPAIVGGSVDKAREQAVEIKRLNPYRGELASLEIAQRQRDTAAVIRGYQSLIDAFPDSARAYSQLTLLYQTRRQWADAWRIVDRWNARMPDSYVARYVIGRTAAESGERGEQGERALREYIAHEPGPGEPSIAAAHWRLGMILEKRGQRDAARREYETAARLDPQLKGAKDGLARVNQPARPTG